MILAALDTPFVMPQTMAFLFAPSALQELKTALQALVARDDWMPVHQLGLKNRQLLDLQVQQLQFAVDAKWLVTLAEGAQKAAQDLKLPLDCTSALQKFREAQKILMPPRSYFTLASALGTADFVKYALAMDDVGLSFVARARLEGLFQALNEYQIQENLGYAERGPHEDEQGTVVIPEWTFEDHPTAEEIRDVKRERAFGQLGSYHLLESLIGVFVPSRGPGPFLPAPPMAQTFKAGEAFEEFLQFKYLLPEDLSAAKDWLAGIKAPTHEWHKPYGLNFDSKDWDELLKQGEWQRCRDRFAALLAEAERDQKGILFLENDLSHPFWPGPHWPERITS